MSQPRPTSYFKCLTDKKMKDLDVMIIPDDSSKRYILDCDLGKYYFYCLCIYVCFIKCNVSFLCICKCLHKLHDVHKDYSLEPERLQIEETYLATINVTFCKMKDLANLHPSSFRIYSAKRTISSTTAI